MQYSNIHGYNMPKLILGTVALGMDYGIANIHGKPQKNESLNILSYALQEGINCFDTARTYGSAEQLIGEFLSSGTEQKITVISKFKISPENIYDIEKARLEVFESVKTSLKYLGIKKIPVCLFHMDRHLPAQEVVRVLPVVFNELISEQLIDIAGVSIDHPSEVSLFINDPVIKAFQVPVNVFDHRLTGNGVLSALSSAGKIVFARSIFLQGLFFLSPGELTGNIRSAAEYLRQLKKLAEDENMTIAQLVFSYILNMDGITGIVFGAENINQVKQNVDLLSVPPLSTKSINLIQQLFSGVPEDIITPGKWVLHDQGKILK